MIQLIAKGQFELYKSKNQTTMLSLDRQTFAWVDAGKLGDILVPANKLNSKSNTFSKGIYRLYEVKGEDELTDLFHLELYVGEGLWQGYLLPTGLPKKNDKNKIIPTKETITRTTH